MAQASCLSHLTECPVCFERLIPLVDTCIVGHAVCQKCRKALKNCPICREEFSANKNVLLNQMLESVPLPCKYKPSGCHEKMVVKELLQHEKMCNYRKELCFLCRENIQLLSFFNHFFYKHSRGSRPGAIDVSSYETFYIGINTESVPNDDSVLIHIRDLQTHFVLRYSLYEGNKIILTIQNTEESDIASNYFYEMRINQELPHDGPRAILTYFGICTPYFYSNSEWKSHKRAITLDLNQIFLSKKLPEEFDISFQIKECYWDNYRN